MMHLLKRGYLRPQIPFSTSGCWDEQKGSQNFHLVVMRADYPLAGARVRAPFDAAFRALVAWSMGSSSANERDRFRAKTRRPARAPRNPCYLWRLFAGLRVFARNAFCN